MSDVWDLNPNGHRQWTLVDGRVVEVGRSPSGNPPGEKGMAVASPSVWFRVDGGSWVLVPKREENSFQQTLELAKNPEWIDRLVQESLSYEANVVLPSTPTVTFQGKHSQYQVFLPSPNHGYVRNEKGAMVATFIWYPHKPKPLYILGRGKLPIGLEEFLTNHMNSHGNP